MWQKGAKKVQFSSSRTFIGYGTSYKNHGFDILMGFSGRFSSTVEGGTTDGNAPNTFVVFGGHTWWIFKQGYDSIDYKLLILHELHHTYGVLLRKAWSLDPNIDVKLGHVTLNGYIMSLNNGNFEYYYSQQLNLSPVIYDINAYSYFFDGASVYS